MNQDVKKEKSMAVSNSIKNLSHEIGYLEAKELEMIDTLQATLNEHRRLNELS